MEHPESQPEEVGEIMHWRDPILGLRGSSPLNRKKRRIMTIVDVSQGLRVGGVVSITSTVLRGSFAVRTQKCSL